MRPTDIIQQRSVALERLLFADMQEIPPALLDQITVEKMEDFLSKRWRFVLRARIYAQRLDEQVVRHPADWWQAVRERFAPRRWLRKFPVRYAEHRMRLFAWYPEKMIPGERSQFLVVIDPVVADTSGGGTRQ